MEIKKLYDFGEDVREDNWNIITDVVLGGDSEAQLFNLEERLAFTGELNPGDVRGFASIRSSEERFQLDDYEGLLVKVRGDGQVYRLCLWNKLGRDVVNYQVAFSPEEGKIVTFRLPFEKFTPIYKGEEKPKAPDLSLDNIMSLGFLISDEQKGDFRLEIMELSAYRNGKE